ncbi:MAG: hypothetical protein LAP40_23595 [Acidobacteriia bacterium]|nr:hypothetical protein [Terriglobia bacterium]
MRTRTSFQKRQKEIARAEKQRDKAAKRQQKKLMGKQPPQTDEELAAELLNEPEGETEDETPAASSGAVE